MILINAILGFALPSTWYAESYFEKKTMETDWAEDVKKYVPDADASAIAGIVRYCGRALRNRDSSLVSFTDKEELARVRNNFLKKKLALTNPDAELDMAILAVRDKMKGERTKNRVTAYYLLADHFGKLSAFSQKDQKPQIG